MIIIEVAGGLGNQMFQYALYQKYLHMGKLAKLDLFSYENPKSMPFELDLFHLPYDVDTKRLYGSETFNSMQDFGSDIRKAKAFVLCGKVGCWVSTGDSEF